MRQPAEAVDETLDRLVEKKVIQTGGHDAWGDLLYRLPILFGLFAREYV